MTNRITNLDITPAQLALDPYSASMVITDVTNGDVLAMVTYPSYDNNKMSNGVDAAYYESLREDASKPLINYATQQKTAPGSTFKLVTATAGLMEGAITTDSEITCTGTFDKISPSPHCWIWPNGAHGTLNVTGGIQNSCNCFFYEVGYRLGLVNGVYDSDTGIEKLKKYADMYGLTETSGVEIEEASPSISTGDSVRSAIGQGNSGFTTTQLARYVTTVANSGTCYNLTLIDKIKDTNGDLLEDNAATIRNVIDLPTSYWDAMHLGMREVVMGKRYFNDFPVNVAGKTGTAQESLTRPNHALFICYAPYESPKIAVATRIANGYTSDYAAQITQQVLKYYFNLADKNDLIADNSTMSGSIAAD
jgi:penicillin-binding protein 2